MSFLRRCERWDRRHETPSARRRGRANLCWWPTACRRSPRRRRPTADGGPSPAAKLPPGRKPLWQKEQWRKRRLAPTTASPPSSTASAAKETARPHRPGREAAQPSPRRRVRHLGPCSAAGRTPPGPSITWVRTAPTVSTTSRRPVSRKPGSTTWVTWHGRQRARGTKSFWHRPASRMWRQYPDQNVIDDEEHLGQSRPGHLDLTAGRRVAFDGQRAGPYAWPWAHTALDPSRLAATKLRREEGPSRSGTAHPRAQPNSPRLGQSRVGQRARVAKEHGRKPAP